MNKKEKLETLLNSLIARGRSPRNKEKVALISMVGEQLRLLEADWSIYTPYSPRLRELVSLESGLWQFVVKNKLYKDNNDIYPHIDRIIEDTYYIGVILEKEEYTISNHKYRLIQSSLVPEEVLGQFLLDNIVIEWNSK